MTARRWAIAFPLMACHAAGVASVVAPDSLTPDSFYRNLAAAEFRTQDNESLRLDSLSGKIVVLNFIFTQCASVCPIQTHALARLRGRLESRLSDRVAFLSVSIDPLNDSPSALKSYADAMSANTANWFFVTGEPTAVFDMVTRMRLLDPAQENARLEDHRTAIWLLDGHGRVMQRYPGENPDIERIAREIAQLEALTRPPD